MNCGRLRVRTLHELHCSKTVANEAAGGSPVVGDGRVRKISRSGIVLFALAAVLLSAASISDFAAAADNYRGAYPPHTTPTPIDVTDCLLEIDPQVCVEYALPYHADPERYLDERRFLVDQPGLGWINTHHAYAKGLTGHGVRIGIEDGGFDVRGAFGQGSYDFVGRLDYVDDWPVTFWNPVFPGALVTQPFLALRPSAHHPDSAAFRKCTYAGACKVFEVDARTPADITRTAFRIVQFLGYPDHDGIWFIHDVSEENPYERWYEIPSLSRIGHGTNVASTAAGYRFGVAPGATVVPMHANFLGYDHEDDALRQIALEHDFIAGSQWFETYLSGLSYAERRQLDAEQAGYVEDYYSNFDILNRSYGGDCEDCTPGDDDYWQWYHGLLAGIEHSAREWPQSWKALAQSGTPDADKTIIVYAAGNEAAPFPSPHAGLPFNYPALRGHNLAVVSIDSRTGVLAGYSNTCGSLPDDWNPVRDGRHYCLAAPGTVNAATPSRDPYSGAKPYESGIIGTSFAAPMVSGALALMMEHFRHQLGNREIALRAVNTANNRGLWADSWSYGAGLMDLKAALSPVGYVHLHTGAYSAPAQASRLVVPAAYGDLGVRLQGLEVAGFDEWNAPFFYRMGDFVRSVAHRPSPIPEFEDASIFADRAPELGLPFAVSALPLSGFAVREDYPSNSLHLIGGEGRVGGLAQVRPGLRLGVIADSQGHMGGTTNGVFGAAAPSVLSWITWRRSRELGSYGLLTGAVTLATSRPDHASGSMFSTRGGLLSAWSLSFSLKDGKNRFTVSQPLRAETGTGILRFAAGRDRDGRHDYRQHKVSLVPEARELDFTWRHERPLGMGRILLAAGGAWNANHTSGGTEGWLGAAWRVRW